MRLSGHRSLRWGWLLAACLLGGCSLFGRREAVPSEPPADVPAPDAASDVAPAAPILWPHLFLNRSDRATPPGYVRVGDLVASPREIEAAAAAEPEDQPADVRAEVREDLLVLDYLRQSELIGDPDFEAQARHRLRSELAQMILDRAIARQPPVTDADVRQHYDGHAADYRLPHRVSIRVILLPTQAEADAALTRLVNGEDFGVLAAELSRHSSGRAGGVLEPFSRGTYSPELEDLAFSLRPGETGSVSTARGVFIVQKIADSRESVVPFEQVAEDIRHELEKNRREQAEAEFLKELEKKG